MSNLTAPVYSYNFTEKIRDVAPIFEQMRASYPIFISLVQLGRGYTNLKNEWIEDSTSPTQSTIISFDTNGDGTGINLASTSGIKAGAILRLTTSADVTRDELIKVVSVDSATDLTVTRGYGSSTPVTFVVGDKVFLVANLGAERTSAGNEDFHVPNVEYNYSQLFDRTADIDKTALLENGVGFNPGTGGQDKLSYQVAIKMEQIMREMNESAIYGRRVARGAGERGSFGGVLQYLTGGNIESTGGSLTPNHLNSALQLIFRDGGFSNNYALLCADNQAMRISSFNLSGTNPVVQATFMDNTYGGSISKFVGNLPGKNGFMANVIVDPNFPRDRIAILDMNKIYLDYLNGDALKEEDATLPGDRLYKRRISGTYSLRVQNKHEAHALITGLTV